MRHFAPDLLTIQPDRALELTVVIPTLNERGNVARLFERLAIALADIEWEAMFVDDGSRDGTPDILTGMAQSDRRIRLIRRFGRRGLSSAVMEGMFASTAPVVAVIDADLQHDERILPDMLKAVTDGGHELAVGTRYASGGSIGQWNAGRARISRAATRLASAVVKTPLSDPMSGFFMLRREVLLEAVPQVSGIGYKVLLDLVASTPRALKVSEIPYEFRTRDTGESKLDSLVALEYLELLLEKSIGRWIPVRFIMFGTIGALGLGVHLTVLALATGALGLRFDVGQTIAVLTAMTFNFVLNNRLTYRDRRLTGWGFLGGLASFYAVCSLGAVANVGVGTALFARQESWWMAGAAGAVVGSVWNYVMGNLFTWRKKR
ncbi:glycosyltransferase family 2 protein [Sphingobium sp. H39-3-25]|uniref:glycosyltransferase family 2 protein n=1 Tax=Sphingobium arseniciresistens TaxID=3030834 RepID=UPI0023B98479|nr:glycosyltransferase family 2 protein [Sphingobium arseniciresistens]